ncbi:adhesion G protein-coupled receptor B2-like [Mytilus californianus]|uniref:adhesion G protein-coupled receptor B2-like n=1 Tax=Mytilus californianus TaxID=6549 RepID=UPI00224618BD|nr:adhesion G protein-coupled receptor B2-like [Mytilus californianus]
MSVNGYPAGKMTMRNQNKSTQFTSEFSSTSVIDQKSYDVTGTLIWIPVIVNNGDTICCDVTHTTTIGSTPQTVCRLISVARLPQVEISPTTYTAAIGDQVIIYCNIVSDSAGVNEVYWQRNSNNQLRIIYNRDVGYQGSTPSTPSLTISFATINDTGTYTCHATNVLGTGNSNTGNVTITGGYLYVSVTPRTSNVVHEHSQNISCNVTGTPTSTWITWLFTPAGSIQHAVLSTTNSNKYTVGTTQEPYLTILNFQPGDSGHYVCRATNAVGSSSSYPGSTLIYISAPITFVEPNQYAAMVDAASFQIQCNVTATPGAFDWYWTFHPVIGSVETISKGTNSEHYTVENSGTNPHLTIRNIALNKTGVYTCFALNTAGTSGSGSNANSKHTLTVTEDSTILCGENIDKFNTKWGITAEKNLLTLPCNGYYTGSVSRYCSNGGKWMEPDYSLCTRKAIQNIHAQSAKLLSGESVDTVVNTILENLENTTSEKNELRSGDLVTSSTVLDDIVRYVTDNTEKLSVDQLEIFGSVCNNILDERNHQLWEELNDEGSSGVPSVVKTVTDYNAVFHKVIDGEFAMIVQKENIVIEVGKTISDEITVPDRLKTSFSWITDSATEMKLKKSKHHDLTGYSSTFYRNISRFFPKYLMLNGELQSFNGSYDVKSIITDFTIQSTASSDHTLIIKFDNLLGNYSRPFCGFWDFDVSNTVNGAWSNFGSRIVESTDSYTICEYNHTTNFAILMSPGRTPLSHNFALSLISAVGCGVSILFLVMTILIHYVLWGYVKSERTQILMNLCVALILSYTIFLAGITRTEIKEVCTAIAIGLHYMFLTDFCLMLAEGIQIVRMVVIVFSTRSIVRWLLPLCWIVPGIVVGISAGITQLKGYGNQQFCWLTLESNLIWAFIGPALLVILINFVIFIIMVYKIMTSRGIAGKELREKIWIGLKSICIILPLFGVTWVLGAFSVNDDLVMFQYLFAIFNSLQGFFICLLHCFFNKEVRQGYNHYQTRRLDLKLSSNSTNTDNTNRI